MIQDGPARTACPIAILVQKANPNCQNASHASVHPDLLIEPAANQNQMHTRISCKAESGCCRLGNARHWQAQDWVSMICSLQFVASKATIH